MCFGVSTPDELVRHSLVVIAPTLHADPTQHSTAETLLDYFFTELARDFALKYCPRVQLQLSDEPLLAEDSVKRANMLALEHYDCDILVGDLPFGVSHAYTASKQPIHALLMSDPVDMTLTDYRRVVADPTHPGYALLAKSSLHATILQTAALPASEQAQAGLLLNPVTWRLCGPDCRPDNMSLAEALSRATANLQAHTPIVLSENSQLWGDLVQLAAVHSKGAVNMKRRNLVKAPSQAHTTTIAGSLSPAQVSILQNANYADRVLFGLVQAREKDQRRCLRSAQAAARRRFHL